MRRRAIRAVARALGRVNRAEELPYRCLECGARFDVAYHVCPECGCYSVEREYSVDGGR